MIIVLIRPHDPLVDFELFTGFIIILTPSTVQAVGINYIDSLFLVTQQKTIIPNYDPNPEPIIPILVLDRDICTDKPIKSSGEGENWTTQKYSYRKKYLIKIYYYKI